MAGVESDSSKFVASNTIEYFLKDKKYIRLHQTDIITFGKDFIILNSGGWKTPTTKNRINSFQSICIISQEKSIWTVKTTTGEESLFYDGLKIKNNGHIVRPIKDDKKTARLLKQINAYCKKLSKLKTLPEPHGGDCFYCQMRDQENKPVDDTRHLLSHLKEKYVMGSLIFNALEAAGYTFPVVIFKQDSRESIVRAVKRYFKKQLSIAC